MIQQIDVACADGFVWEVECLTHFQGTGFLPVSFPEATVGRDLPDVDGWIAAYAGTAKGEGIRPVPNAEEAKACIRDGVIGSMAPLISAAELAGVDVPVTRSMVTIASTILGADVTSAGRRLDTIGIRENDIGSARAKMDAIATGSA